MLQSLLEIECLLIFQDLKDLKRFQLFFLKVKSDLKDNRIPGPGANPKKIIVPMPKFWSWRNNKKAYFFPINLFSRLKIKPFVVKQVHYSTVLSPTIVLI